MYPSGLMNSRCIGRAEGEGGHIIILVEIYNDKNCIACRE